MNRKLRRAAMLLTRARRRVAVAAICLVIHLAAALLCELSRRGRL